MCEKCNYTEMLEEEGVDPTPLREAVLRFVGEGERPLSAAEILAAVRHKMSINKVTLYRILDLLVDKGLVRRLSAGDRAFRYGIGETSDHPDHPHFVCDRCGIMECLDPALLPSRLKTLGSENNRVVRNIELRLEGICERCLNRKRKGMSAKRSQRRRAPKKAQAH